MHSQTSNLNDAPRCANLRIRQIARSRCRSTDRSTTLGAAPRYDSKAAVLLALRAAPWQRRQHREAATMPLRGAASFRTRKRRFVKKRGFGSFTERKPRLYTLTLRSSLNVLLLFKSALNVVQLFILLMFVNVVEQCSGQIFLARMRAYERKFR